MSTVIRVIETKVAKEQYGKDAKEMRVCPACAKQHGILINIVNEMDCNDVNQEGKSFTKIIWERWRCLACSNVWIERYAVSLGGKRANKEYKGSFANQPPVGGVAKRGVVV